MDDQNRSRIFRAKIEVEIDIGNSENVLVNNIVWVDMLLLYLYNNIVMV